MEDREGKNKFWKGILIGALGNSALWTDCRYGGRRDLGSWGRMTANQLGAASLAEKRERGRRRGREGISGGLSICLRSGLSLRIWRAL